jgi:hypothetical protein
LDAMVAYLLRFFKHRVLLPSEEPEIIWFVCIRGMPTVAPTPHLDQ